MQQLDDYIQEEIDQQEIRYYVIEKGKKCYLSEGMEELFQTDERVYKLKKILSVLMHEDHQ